METPLVSICCLTYNHSKYIRQCLDGFMIQKTSFPFEVLIHDDASTDGTQEIIDEYKNRYPDIIKPIYQKENQYSKGIEVSNVYQFSRAKGKYIALCEGDDYWIDPLKLQKQVTFLEINIEYGMVYSNAQIYNQDRKVFLQHLLGSKKNSTYDLLFSKTEIPTLTTVFRYNLYLEYVNDVEIMKNKWKMGDYPLWIFISSKCKIKYQNDVTAVYRELAVSASHFKTFESNSSFLESIYHVRSFFFSYLEMKKGADRIKGEYYAGLLGCYLKYNRNLDEFRDIISKEKNVGLKILLMKKCARNKIFQSFLRWRWKL